MAIAIRVATTFEQGETERVEPVTVNRIETQQ